MLVSDNIMTISTIFIQAGNTKHIIVDTLSRILVCLPYGMLRSSKFHMNDSLEAR